MHPRLPFFEKNSNLHSLFVPCSLIFFQELIVILCTKYVDCSYIFPQDLQQVYRNRSECHLTVFCINTTTKACYHYIHPNEKWQMAENKSAKAKQAEDNASWCTNGGDKHEWKQWHEYVKHCRKYRCERQGCGFFKKCWTKCEDINCKGCHVIGHKRW